MRRTGLWLAVGVVVTVNLGALGFAALNREGEPEAVLQLTEREARLESGGAENTAVSLRLMWIGPGRTGEPGWFDQAKLAALGFDCSGPVNPKNLKRYSGQPPRRVYAALEFEGPAWEKYAASLAPETDKTSADGVSHLMLVDLDRDAVRLRARHPDRARVAIVRAIVALWVDSQPGRPPRLSGRVLDVLCSEVNLTKDLRRVVEPLVARDSPALNRGRTRAGAQPGAPRYVATIRWGRQLEPWADSIRLADARP